MDGYGYEYAGRVGVGPPIAYHTGLLLHLTGLSSLGLLLLESLAVAFT